MFVPGKLLQLSLTFVGKLSALPWHISSAPFRKAVLSSKGLTKTNTLAYHEHSFITDVKSFIILGADQLQACTTKPFKTIMIS